MRSPHFFLLFLQTVVFVHAQVNWTLHKSCYRNKKGDADDNELANAMVDAMKNVKAWAGRGAKKLGDSVDFNPTHGSATKEAMQPLLGKGNYRDNAREVKALFENIVAMNGPVGESADAAGRFDQSGAWNALRDSPTHYSDFLLVCRPDLEKRTRLEDPANDWYYDLVRENWVSRSGDLLTLLKAEGDDKATWDSLPKNGRIKANTAVDAEQGNRADRNVPETINFHPLWIQFQREKGFGRWDDRLFNEVTADEAPEAYKAKGRNGVTIRPVDGLIDQSFVFSVFHELFHLTALGGMKDETPIGQVIAYGWHSNSEAQDRRNPDLYAIIAMVIELLNRDGQQYKVSQEGIVSKR